LPEVTFLGTGGSYVSQQRACAGIYFEGKLMDCGFGVLANIRRAGIHLDRIERVFITHTHSDHIGDFTGLIWAMALEGRKKRLEVVSSKDTASALKRVMELQSTPREILNFSIDYLEPEAAGVEFCTTVHTPTNYAYRVEVSGKAITYTGDTSPCRDVVKLAKGSDLLIHDSTYLADREALGVITKHSSGRQAAAAAKEARVRMLALTHIFAGHSDEDYVREVGEVEGVRAIVARDLLKLDV
jgi:ribonuclease BN (tRNA processing enzyme)